MKSRKLLVVLPIATMVALTGTGFGAWIFSSTGETTKKLASDIELQPALSVGDNLTAELLAGTKVADATTKADHSKIKFDQELTSDSNADGDVANFTLLIHLSFKMGTEDGVTGTNTDSTYTPTPLTGTNLFNTSATDHVLTFQVESTINTSHGIQNYLLDPGTLTNAYSDSTETTSGIAKTGANTDKDTHVTTTTFTYTGSLNSGTNDLYFYYSYNYTFNGTDAYTATTKDPMPLGTTGDAAGTHTYYGLKNTLAAYTDVKPLSLKVSLTDAVIK